MRRRSITVSLARASMALALVGRVAAAEHAHEHRPTVSPPTGAMEGVPAVRTPEQRKLQIDFRLELMENKTPVRSIYERYLTTLGAQPMLDVLEERDKFCHAEAHELGQALYALRANVGLAIAECGARCTHGCIHGVFKEAYGNRPVEDVIASLPKACNQRGIERPGSCAHGLGHALVVAYRGDASKALAGCDGFGDPPMAFYCQSGVFMELFSRGSDWKAEIAKDRLYPCNLPGAYPTACFRMLFPRLLADVGYDKSKVLDLCRSLPRAQRLGCMYSYGAYFVSDAVVRPDYLTMLCPAGPADDATVCIEGVVENLAVYSPAGAASACDALHGDAAEVCRDAAREGTYRLAKSTLPLYLLR